MIDPRSTTGLVRRTMAGDPQLLAYNIIRTLQGIGCGLASGVTLRVKEGGSGPGDGGIH